MECSICKLQTDKEEKREIIQCDWCKTNKCSICTGMAASEVRAMQLKSPRVLKYLCEDCLNIPQQIKSIEVRVKKEMEKMHIAFDQQNKKITEQNELIINLLTQAKAENKTGKTTYADAIKRTSEVLVVKPKEKQESIKTKSDLKDAIDPKSLAISVENIKEGKQGTVIINCNNATTKEKIKEKVENELGAQYKVSDGTLKNPKVIICGVEEEVLQAEDQGIIDMVKEQNELELDIKDIHVSSKYMQKNKTNKGNIIMTVTPELKNKMCNQGRLNIGWRRCMVQEFFTVVRCFKCARYGHIAAKCNNNITCFKCAGLHRTSECDSDLLKCINCSETNNKLNKSLKINHAVTDNECACYKRILEFETRKTKHL